MAAKKTSKSKTAELTAVLPRLWHILRSFAPYLRREKPMIAGGMTALFLEVAVKLLEPWPLKIVLDYVLMDEPKPAWLPAWDVSTLLLGAAIAILILAVFRGVMAYTKTVSFALIGNRVLTKVRARLYRHLQQLSLNYHTSNRSGDLVIRIIGDVGALKEVAVTAMLPLLGNILILVGMIGVMLWMNWQLALIAATTIPLFWLTSTRISRRIHAVAKKQRQYEGDMAASASEAMTAIKTIQALGLEEPFEEVFNGQNKKSMKDGVKAKKLEARLERSVDIMIAASTGLVLWFGARQVLDGALTPGDLIVFLSYLKSAFRPVRSFAKYTSRLSRAAAAGERVLAVLDEKPEIQDSPDAVPAERFTGQVQFEDVHFSYSGNLDHAVLRGIQFTVEPGERVAVVGPSGIGKSTLLGLLMRLYDPQGGTVRIDGQDIRDFTLESLRRQIGVVLQDGLLFAGTIRSNIACFKEDATEADIEAAARSVNAHDFILAQPNGYDTVVGERGMSLSSGQRQRLAVARAALRDTPVLILDEPTTGLDEENEAIVIDALRRLSEGRTTFVITHDMAFASEADRIIFLEHGLIRESGSHAELIKMGGRYAAMYQAQSESSTVSTAEADHVS